jgi:dephospho-CoA kinase
VRWLICLAGGIASGKTTLAAGLQAALPGSVRLAFGDVVRRRAQAVHPEPTREELQETGLQLIHEGWPAFVGELLSDLGGDPSVLIVEGIRHPEAVGALHEQLPERRVLLVYVEVSDRQRNERLAQRAESELTLMHEVESEVALLRAMADLAVETDQPIEGLVTLILGHLQEEAR